MYRKPAALRGGLLVFCGALLAGVLSRAAGEPPRTGPGSDAVRAALGALGAAQFVGRGVAQGVRGGLPGVADEAVPVPVNLVLVHRDQR